jgi:cytoskeletal protein RodZ
MQLNEILEENSIQAIAKRTNISEENLEALFNGEFGFLKKVKTMGFISIIEREYVADLSALRKQAAEYYADHREEGGMVLEAPVVERKKGKSKLLIISVIVLLGVASWYFITQFDKEKLRGLLPFNEEKIADTIKTEVDENPDLSIENAIAVEPEKKENETSSIVIEAVPAAETTSSKTEENQSN